MPEEKKPGQPPIPFEKEYIGLLLEHMAKGLSFESFPGYLREKFPDRRLPGRATLYAWTEEFKEFLDARDLGKNLHLYFHEVRGHKGAYGDLKNFNATAWAFIMRNCHPDIYQDVNRSETNTSLDVSYKPEELIALGLKARDGIEKNKFTD